MSDNVSFEENPQDSANSGFGGAKKRAPLMGAGYDAGPKKGLTQLISEQLGVNEMVANILQIAFALIIFGLSGFIFYSALGK